MKFTLGTAAKEVNKAKSTLSRDIKNGRISADKQLNGSYLIDASELFRVYPKCSSYNSNGTVVKEQSATLKEHQMKIEFLERILREKEEMISELKEEKARLLGLVEKQTNLLEHHQSKKPFWKVF